MKRLTTIVLTNLFLAGCMTTEEEMGDVGFNLERPLKEITIEHIRAEAKSNLATARKYCYGEIVKAQRITRRVNDCSDDDCESEWVKTPPKKHYADCDSTGTCPLDKDKWYPKSCANLLFDRCEVQLDNISACKSPSIF